jgi:hypothetical protein
VSIDQLPVASEPAPDEQLAAIPGAPELAADVPARKPNAPVPDSAEQGWSSGPDDPDVQERHEVVGVVRGYGSFSFRTPRRHTWGESGPCRDGVAGLDHRTSPGGWFGALNIVSHLEGVGSDLRRQDR